MKTFLVSFLLIASSILFYNAIANTPQRTIENFRPSNYVQVANQITGKTAKELRKKFDLGCCGSCGGAIDIIRGMGLMMNVYRPLTIEEARRLAVDCKEIFLNNVNTNKTIRPFLIEYPFPQSRIEIIFYVTDKVTGGNLKSSLVRSFETDENGISYEVSNPKTGEEEAVREPYEEAKKTVLTERLKEQQSDAAVASSQNEPFAKKTSQPFFVLDDMCGGMDTVYDPKYLGPDEERAMGWALDKYAVQVAKTQRMKFHLVGNPTDIKNLDYFLSFQTAQPMTLDVARVFATNILDDFWTMLKKSPEVKTYHEKSKITYKNYKSNSFTGEIAALKQVGLKIAYWDENVERLQCPYIAQVLFIGGTFQYFEADPQTQALRLVYQESYDEAMAFLSKQQI